MVPSDDGVTLLVASTGGHLTELHQLWPRLTHVSEVEWVTFDTDQSRDLLAGQRVHYVPHVRPKDLRGTVANLPRARALLSTRSVRRVVSTGAAVAVPYLVVGRRRGLPVHYVESAARTLGPSLTGRLIAALPGAHLYAQHAWPGSPSRWHRRGSVFDGFATEPRAGSTQPLRVVVTFGTQAGYGFERAARRIVPLLRQVAPQAEVLWQVGDTDMTGLDVDHVGSVPYARMVEQMAQADLVISHAGVGTALAALEVGHVPVLVPRRRAHHEHTDDHQAEIAAELQARGLAVHAEAEELAAAHLRLAMSSRVSAVAASRFTLAESRG